MADKDNTAQDPDSIELVKEGPGPAPEENKIILAREVLPRQLPIIPVNQRPLFPKMTVPMVIDDEPLVSMLIELVKSQPRLVGIVLRRDAGSGGGEGDGQPDKPTALHPVGVVAEVVQLAQAPADRPAVQMIVTALERFRIDRVVRTEPHTTAAVEYLHEVEMTANEELKAYSLALIKSIKELIQLNPLHKEQLSLFMSQSSLGDPGRLGDFAAALTTSTGEELQEILETIRIRERLQKVLVLVKKEIGISRIQVKIGKQIEEKLTKQQREFFLREQLKAIKKELGLEKEGKETEIERFTKRLETLTLPEEARERIDEEMSKLKLLEPSSPEFNVTRGYLDWLTCLPWGVHTKDNYDITAAGGVLDEDHYGLEDVKERVLEFLSVGVMKGMISGTILCFVGPPGVGKTSIGRSIARCIGRNFYRFSLGGMRDEAEIKGHRRTYIGALPGKFVQAIKTCRSANPVIMLDEIDKIGASYRGDPASALLEVLDSEQNRDFLDHYLDVRFDLSNVFFICTANQLDTIPRPLLDRMEVIKLAGYILQEKLEIARRYLIPKQLKAHGATRRQITITARALRDIIDGYAREPGVRGLENHIKKIMRRSVKGIVEGKTEKVQVDKDQVPELLGKRRFTEDGLYKTPVTGVVTGLAWTSMGGDTLFIEATKVATGKAGFKQTGQLGNVMVESSEIAYTYIRSFLDAHQQAGDFFKKHFVHLHVPAGATPKDGPSAGITMACALYSLALGKPIKKSFAMTGELTLTGRVMPIGGLKEKAIAAKRANIRNLVFPERNREDFEELPAHIRKGLKPHFVSTFTDVVTTCFRR